MVEALRARARCPTRGCRRWPPSPRPSSTRAAASATPSCRLREVGYTDGNALEVIVGVGLATICNFGNNLAQTPLNTQLADYAWSPKQ